MNFLAYSHKMAAKNKHELQNSFKFYKKALDQDKENILTNFNLGEYYYEVEDYENSLKHFKVAYDQSEEFSKIGYNMGMCYLKLGGKDKALRMFK